VFGKRKQKRPAGPRENLKRGSHGQDNALRAGTRSIVRVVLGAAKLAAVLGCLVLAGWGGPLLWRNAGPWMADLFRVREITVVGLQQVTRAEVLTRLRLDNQAILYDIDPEKLVERLRTHPWIKDAELTRLPLHQLQVRIVERRPAAVVQRSEINVLVDEEGQILKWLGRIDEPSLPLCVGVEPRSLAQRASRERRTIKAAVTLAGILAETASDRIVIDATNPANLIATVKESRLSFGNAGFQEKWSLYARLRPNLATELRIAGDPSPIDVDLRFAGRVIVRERG
jgi:cell division protein FtsQ